MFTSRRSASQSSAFVFAAEVLSSRKTSFLAVAAVAALMAAVPATRAAGTLDPAKPEDALLLNRKMTCSLEDGQTVIHWWRGSMLSRVPGEPNRLLFNVHGMNMRQCRVKQDPVRGFCYRSVSREVMFYLDPVTNEMARRWKSPWSNEEVDVVHVANDPVNARDWYCSRDKDGKPVDRSDNLTFKDDLLLEGGGAARLFYKSPLAGEYQDYVGGTYHAMEFGTSAALASEALDATDSELQDTLISWVRISRWLPWMKMGDRDGLVVFHTAGMRLDDWEQLPEVVRREVDTRYPSYKAPPPLDDLRPNETSWTVFKKFIDERRAKESPAN